jgi:RimJ/RimL family protein N-acetyltransferase
MNPTIPLTIDSSRVTLRPFEHTDWPALHAHYSDLECTRFTFKRALTEGESWRAMSSMVGHWSLRGYGPYALSRKTDNKVIGAAGLWFPNDWPEPEIKWALAREHWGQGYASEAVRAVQSMISPLWDRMPISFIHSDNAASLKLAESVRARLESTREFRGALWHVYRHPKIV